jgi:iron complex outermembrane receptor protein
MRLILRPLFPLFKLSSVFLFLGWCSVLPAFSQYSIISGIVKDSVSSEVLPGASIMLEPADEGTTSSGSGTFIFTHLDAGNYLLTVSFIGYQGKNIPVRLTNTDSVFVELLLQAEEIESEEVVITATRTVRHIDDVPVRIEAIPQEEVEEKLLMTPSNVAMLLNESTGMRVQTTSAVSSTANLRIQGLSGRYTQILSDGIPNLGGLSSGFGITQLVPLNLRQVEVIKGASSTLYGANAISGTVNFITKDPQEHPEFSALLNATTQEGYDGAAFFSSRFNSLGITLMGSRNTQKLFDVDNDSFGDVAEFERFSFTPKIIYTFSDDAEARFQFGLLSEERTGGTIHTVPSPASSLPVYREEIKTNKFDLSTQFSWTIDDNNAFVFKLARTYYRRNGLYGGSSFIGDQEVYFADIQQEHRFHNHSFLGGATYVNDFFSDRTPRSSASQSYRYTNAGFFAQDEITLNQHWSALVSGRVDFHNRFGNFFTPKASIMYRPAHSVTIRAGGGTGFKAPSIFVEEAEEVGFNKIHLADNVEPEQAYSASCDVNWRTMFGGTGVTVNIAFYLTSLDHALIADEDSLQQNAIFLRNATGTTLARGGEISTKLTLWDFKLSLGYTYIYASQQDKFSEAEVTLNPRHSLGAILFWESEEQEMKVGIENYWTGNQRLERNPFRSQAPSYWITGLIAEKGLGNLRLFINFENIFDTRQTRFHPIALTMVPNQTIQRTPIYAPLEGRVINGGIRFVL